MIEPVFTPENAHIYKGYHGTVEEILDIVRGGIVMESPIVILPRTGMDDSHLVLLYPYTLDFPLP